MWRYRLTLTVDTPEGSRSGSSVIQVNVDKSRRQFRVSGEAVMVDLGKRGSFLAILRSEQNVDNASAIVPAAFPGPPPGTPDGIRYYSALRAEVDIPASVMPMLVRFYVNDDPKTVARVDRANLAASFGPGVSLARARIEMVPVGVWPLNILGISTPEALTGIPVTRTLEGKIPWLDRYFDRHFDESKTQKVSENQLLTSILGSGYFSAGR
jgi:hypothetical protein